MLTTIVIRLQSAASQSQHVVNILTSGDPVNAGDVDKVEADERNNNSTGLLAKGGPTAKIQVSVTGCCFSCSCAGADVSVINNRWSMLPLEQLHYADIIVVPGHKCTCKSASFLMGLACCAGCRIPAVTGG